MPHSRQCATSNPNAPRFGNSQIAAARRVGCREHSSSPDQTVGGAAEVVRMHPGGLGQTETAAAAACANDLSFTPLHSGSLTACRRTAG